MPMTVPVTYRTRRSPYQCSRHAAFKRRYDNSRDEHRALASLGADLLRRARESQPALEAAWDALLVKWGVHGDPLGIQRLRAMIADECGTKPEDNAFSRELIALREEHRP